jgi:superfamily II DNA/RNA helicase
VEVIIQFDLALDAISFIHRIGRTGRLGKKGEVVNFVREKDQFLFSRIKEILSEK